MIKIFIFTGHKTDESLTITAIGKWLLKSNTWDLYFISRGKKTMHQHLKDGISGYEGRGQYRRDCEIKLLNSIPVDSAIKSVSNELNIQAETMKLSRKYDKRIADLKKEISDSRNNLEFETKFNKEYEVIKNELSRVQQEKSSLESKNKDLNQELTTFKKKEAIEIKRKENEEKEKILLIKQNNERVKEENRKREERKNNNLKFELISSELVIAQNLIRDLEDFIKSNPSEFDIVEIAELLIENRQILGGIWNEETAISFTKLQEYLNNSENFNQFYNQKEEDRYNNALVLLNEEYESLLSNQKELENKLNENLTSEFAPLLVEKVKIIRNVLKDFTLELLIKTNLEISAFKTNLSMQIEEQRFEEENKNFGIEETNKNLSELKELLSVNLTNDNAPLILEKINYLKDLNTDILNSKSILNINLETSEFINKIGGNPLIETEQSNNKINSENQNDKTTNNSLKSNLAELVSYFITICIEDDEIQTRNGFIYLPNKTEPFTGENLCAYRSNNQYSSKGKIKGGKYEGKWTKWYESGQIKVEQNFKDGKKDGKWTEWYKSGQIKYASNWKDGKADGKSTDWYENGKLWREGNYKDDKAEGKWTEWNESGQIKADLNYKDNVLITETQYWYHDNSQIFQVQNYKFGKADGKWTQWYENGKKSWERSYKDDKADGKFTQWYENGKKQIEGIDLDGKKHGTWNWWLENGQRHVERVYLDNRCVSGDC